MLPRFDELVQEMDVGLLDPETGFGTVIQLLLGTTVVEVDALVIDPEPSDRLQSARTRPRGMRVKPGLVVQLRAEDVPHPYPDYRVRLDAGGPVYCIADVEPVDRGLSELSLVPENSEAPLNGAWLRDET